MTPVHITNKMLSKVRDVLRYLKDSKKYADFQESRKTTTSALAARYAKYMQIRRQEEIEEAIDILAETLREYGITDNNIKGQILNELKKHPIGHGETLDSISSLAAAKFMRQCNGYRKLQMQYAFTKKIMRKIILAIYLQCPRMRKNINRYNKNIYKNVKLDPKWTEKYHTQQQKS